MQIPVSGTEPQQKRCFRSIKAPIGLKMQLQRKRLNLELMSNQVRKQSGHFSLQCCHHLRQVFGPEHKLKFMLPFCVQLSTVLLTSLSHFVKPLLISRLSPVMFTQSVNRGLFYRICISFHLCELEHFLYLFLCFLSLFG